MSDSDQKTKNKISKTTTSTRSQDAATPEQVTALSDVSACEGLCESVVRKLISTLDKAMKERFLSMEKKMGEYFQGLERKIENRLKSLESMLLDSNGEIINLTKEIKSEKNNLPHDIVQGVSFNFSEKLDKFEQNSVDSEKRVIDNVNSNTMKLENMLKNKLGQLAQKAGNHPSWPPLERQSFNLDFPASKSTNNTSIDQPSLETWIPPPKPLPKPAPSMRKIHGKGQLTGIKSVPKRCVCVFCLKARTRNRGRRTQASLVECRN